MSLRRVSPTSWPQWKGCQTIEEDLSFVLLKREEAIAWSLVHSAGPDAVIFSGLHVEELHRNSGCEVVPLVSSIRECLNGNRQIAAWVIDQNNSQKVNLQKKMLDDFADGSLKQTLFLKEFN
jgi:hypothetical protein